MDTNLFDITIPRGDMYRAEITPELYPEERPMVLDNWPSEDKEAYCGGEFARAR